MKINPKLANMSQKEREEWDKKLAELEQGNVNRDMTNQLRQGKGWIF